MTVQLRGMKAGLIAICQVPGAVAAAVAGPFPAGSESSGNAGPSTIKREWAKTVAALQGCCAAQRGTAVARAGQELDALDLHIEQFEFRTRQRHHDLHSRIVTSLLYGPVLQQHKNTIAGDLK